MKRMYTIVNMIEPSGSSPGEGTEVAGEITGRSPGNHEEITEVTGEITGRSRGDHGGGHRGRGGDHGRSGARSVRREAEVRGYGRRVAVDPKGARVLVPDAALGLGVEVGPVPPQPVLELEVDLVRVRVRVRVIRVRVLGVRVRVR